MYRTSCRAALGLPLLLNHRDGPAVVAMDSITLTEAARFLCSRRGGTRPVQACRSPRATGSCGPKPAAW